MKFFRLSVLAIFFFFSSRSIAQIGINTITPDSSASLHILSKPSGSGLIIPELTEAQRLAISKPAIGLMVYDITSKLFYVNLDNTPGNHWFAINPTFTQGTVTAPDVMYTSPAVTKVGIGIQPPQLPQATLDVNGDIRANTSVSTNTLNVTGFPTNALVPSGIITMWSGNMNAIPTGWALCDGTTHGTFVTPDLRGRFIVGAGQNIAPNTNEQDNTNYSVNDKGGINKYKHTAAESGLPVHAHTAEPHNHSYKWTVNSDDTKGGAVGTAADPNEVTNNGTTSPATVTINNSIAQDAAQAHENRPSYYALAYIIKLP